VKDRSVVFSKTSSVYSNILVNFSMWHTIEEKRKMRNGSKKGKQHQKSQFKRAALIELRIRRCTSWCQSKSWVKLAGLASMGALLLNITNFGEVLTSTKNYKLSWTTGQALIRYTQFLIQIHFINPFINAPVDVKPLGGRVGHLIFHAIFGQIL
jgi:hypothetical protein